MINIAVCDDEKYFVDKVHAQIKEFFLDKRIECRITDHTSGILLAEHAADYDLIFIDVQMDMQDGFKTAEKIRKNGFSGCLIFVTIMKEDVYKAFEYGAFDYLVKPLSQTAFEHTMERFLKSLKSNEDQLLITCKNEQHVVRTADILYCEVINRKIELHLANGAVIGYYGKISDLEKKLGSGFFKSHRSYLVNLRHILSYTVNIIELENGEKIPLSRSRKVAFMSALIDDINGKDEVQ